MKPFQNFSATSSLSHFSHKVQSSQLFEDPEASGCVFSGTGRFAVSATATGIKATAVVTQPSTVEGVRVFEAHNITVLHRGTINSVLGEDLESDVVVVEPVVPYHRAG